MDQRFSGLVPEERADIFTHWAAPRHATRVRFRAWSIPLLGNWMPGCGTISAPFLEARFRAHRLADSREDAEANRKNAAAGV